ncbi:uncharacterized protein prr11 [Echeneis naucrates]|uniref:uncharacterized protein prr11 n=1 Tax=Echeneis naucrates TaxID=173247 RepID=UPI001113DCA2|nr:uncharacterized protein LOC115052285 [Echeneis naucrates]
MCSHHVTGSNSLQIPPQPSLHQALLANIEPIPVQALINPQQGMDAPLQLQTPQPPKTCGSPSCWSLDIRVAILLLTLAGALILLLLYRLLQLRHRLRSASARHALEYCSFYHTANYTLKHPAPCEDLPVKNGTVPEAALPAQTITAVNPVVTSNPPPLPLPPPPVLPPPSLPTAPPVLALPLPVPVIQTTPPSPHLSWGACSDVDVYSRIGAFRSSRLSSLSNHSKVILFEHSSL